MKLNIMDFENLKAYAEVDNRENVDLYLEKIIEETMYDAKHLYLFDRTSMIYNTFKSTKTPFALMNEMVISLVNVFLKYEVPNTKTTKLSDAFFNKKDKNEIIEQLNFLKTNYKVQGISNRIDFLILAINLDTIDNTLLCMEIANLSTYIS